MQTNGNFVVYKDHQPVWQSHTVSRGDLLILQENGNLVIYKDNNPTWWSGTGGTDVKRLVMYNCKYF
jgi:hypothetical protein